MASTPWHSQPAPVICVTGGAGFVGSHLIETLLRRYPEAQIVSIDNYLMGDLSNHIQSERVKYIVANTWDIEDVWKQHKLSAPHVVFHLGEFSRIMQSFEDFDIAWESIIRGTKAVLSFTAEHGAKFVYAGSSSKFGNEGLDENLSPYAWMKAKNVEFVINYNNWFNVDFVVTYFFNVYGPRQISSGKYATLIGIYETKMLSGEPLPVVAPGTQTRDFTHVADIVSGIILCAERGEGDGYSLGTGTNYSILEVAEMFGGEVKMKPEEPGNRKWSLADYSKVEALGWEPEHNLKDYIEEFLEANNLKKVTS